MGSLFGWHLAYRCCRCIFRWHVMCVRRLLCYPLPRPFYQFDMAIPRGLNCYTPAHRERPVIGNTSSILDNRNPCFCA
ncbi:hypothetical protein BDV59DRAFT_188502 [Aspergillus ambiguus]|uniref:uncharacterized protein n=1 Tax=Aspergillus ambiguus TaxID=176160 RepID=UPI003CCE5278